MALRLDLSNDAAHLPSLGSPHPCLAFRKRAGSSGYLMFGVNQRVYCVVVTGGPCSGKSSAAAVLSEELSRHGFLVFTLPRVSTMMENAGAGVVQFADSEEKQAEYHTNHLRLQILHEDSFLRLCRGTGKPCVVICEDGLMEGKAHCSPAVWEAVTQAVGLSEPAILQRYTTVAFMTTAAAGAEVFYTEDSKARPPLEEALQYDRRLRACWADHPRLCVFDNDYPCFPEKVDSVVRHVLAEVAEATEPRRFAVPYPSIEACKASFPDTLEYVEHTIREIVLPTLGTLKEVQGPSQLRHYVQEQTPVADVIVQRTSKILPEVFAEYERLAEQQGAPSRTATTCHFQFKQVLWELYFSETCQALVLKTHASAEQDLRLALPPFLAIGPEVFGVDSPRCPRG